MNNPPVKCICVEGPDSPELLQECLRAARVIYRWMAGRVERIGLTPVQLEVLQAVSREEGLPLHRLRDALCCAGSNVTALVDRMERDGLVERRRDPGDRRVIRLSLGQVGRERLALWGDTPRCCPETTFALNEEERRLLARLIRRLADGLETPSAEREES